MLQAVRLKNFVKFHEDCNLSFRDGGAYFFVGQNGSGKSSVLEAIRRCLSRDSNTSFSRIPDESKPSYIICEYKIPDRSLFVDRKKIFTSFLYIPDTASTYKYAKIVLLVDTNDTNDVFIEFIKRENGAHDMKHCTCSFQAENEKKIRIEIGKYLPLCTIDNDNSDTSITSLLAYLKQLLDAKREDTGTSETTDEKLEVDTFLKTLEKSLVFTFSLRSLGPLQWSKSKLIEKSKREGNYKFAREKCEVIDYFLSSDSSNKYDSENERKLFRMLTDQANYSFYRKEDDLVAVKLDDEGVEVLKMSEGILEAKYLSLLLASKEFFTVLLEEPDRGMHPQMIQIIRDIVLPEVKDKTIIIVSHNPGLISSWSIPRTYKFYKERDGDKWTSKMIPVKRVVQEGQNKIPRLLSSEDYASIIFARNVIFVEGQSDFYFVKALVANILTQSNDTSMQKVLHLALSEKKTNPQQFDNSEIGKVTKSNEYSEDKLSQFRNFLASLHVVNMNGEKSKHKWKHVSRNLGLPGLFLLDSNAVFQVQNQDSCILTTDKVKSDIKRFVIEAIKTKAEVISQGTQQSPSSQNPQELTEVKREASETNIQQSLTEVVEPEQGKQKTNTVHNMQEYSDLARKDEYMEITILETAMEKIKEVIKEIVSSIDSYDIETLKTEAKTNYREYIRFVYKDLLYRNPDKIPKSTILSPLKREVGVFLPNISLNFMNLVEAKQWPEAYECLEKEGVFVWRTGNLEDAFIDLVINFECADESTKYDELLKRHMVFVRHGIHLNLSKLSTRSQTKLFMDDQVSDENIKESIVSALKLCGKNSDITTFIRFLVSRVKQ
ncbi:hypothetical protein ACJMK2_036833 [Sinanodonta woodiana]|uniref:Endonuclease GajA/Old nuclease/RecF-like AAA domain-containing protein n=1 Tax=Sinanodonta woodiana TaxID=1069815 RepID=A0ABD3WIF4_SINWO